jgi:hypothetical protein
MNSERTVSWLKNEIDKGYMRGLGYMRKRENNSEMVIEEILHRTGLKQLGIESNSGGFWELSNELQYFQNVMLFWCS